MAYVYPVLLVIMSFLLALSMFFCFRSPNTTHRQQSNSNQTAKIDKLINNSNQGKETIHYKKSLECYNIKYLAWRVNQNGAVE